MIPFGRGLSVSSVISSNHRQAAHELESALATNDISIHEADAKQREITRKDVFSADDAAQLKQLKDLQDSYAVINEGLKKKAALADTEAHKPC